MSGIPAYDRRWRRRASQNQHLAVRSIATPWRKPPSTSPPRGAVSANSCILFRCTRHIDREPGLVVEKDRSRAHVKIRTCSSRRIATRRAAQRLACSSLQIRPAPPRKWAFRTIINQLSESMNACRMLASRTARDARAAAGSSELGSGNIDAPLDLRHQASPASSFGRSIRLRDAAICNSLSSRAAASKTEVQPKASRAISCLIDDG